MRVVAYIRVSTDDQAQNGVSLDAQREQITAYARLYKHEVTEIISDEGLSGKTLNRPGLQRALAMLKARKTEGILIAKLDRLTRSVRDLGFLIETYFSNGHGALLSVNDQLDTATANGRFVVHMLGSVAQWERESIGERTATALRHKRAKGEVISPVPLGYDRIDDKTDGVARLVPNAAEQAILERIRRERAAGKSMGAIAANLNADGVKGKAGGRFYASTIAKILSHDT